MIPPAGPNSADGRIIVFAHANGYPAGTYEPLFARWAAAGWQVRAPGRLGHDAAYPVTSNWPRLRDELADFVARTAPGGAVLVGHSLGGILSLLVACRRPELARAVVMLDSPIVTGWRAHGLHMAKRTRLIERLGPAPIARRRRHQWPTREAVHAHFAAKSIFARWDPRMLDAYVRAGFDDGADAHGRPCVVLGFSREVETRIYETLPHHASALLRRHRPRCPVAFVAGSNSAEMRQAGHAASRALAQGRWRTIEGSHLYPMERPDETAAVVLELLDEMAAATPPGTRQEPRPGSRPV